MGEIANSRMRRHLTADEQELLPTGCFSFLLLYPEIRPVSASHQSPITNHQSPITNHQSPITNHQSPITNHLSPITFHQSPFTSPLSPLTLLPHASSEASRHHASFQGRL